MVRNRVALSAAAAMAAAAFILAASNAFAAGIEAGLWKITRLSRTAA